MRWEGHLKGTDDMKMYTNFQLKNLKGRDNSGGLGVER